MTKIPSIQTVIGLLLCGTLFCFWGWYNGYPFVYPDTGTYVDSGFENYLPGDRPITYGLFCRHISMSESLLWVMLVQGVLSAVLVREWLRAFAASHLNPATMLAAVVFLISCTTASIYASFITPDFLTPIFYGILIALLVVPSGRWRAALLSTLALFAAMTHNSHLLGGLVFGTCLLGYQFWASKEQRFTWKKVGLVWAIVVVGWIGLFALNISYGKKWDIMPDSHAFTMGRLHEIGLVRQYLDVKCADTNLYLCPQKDAIPDDILWDSNSPMSQGGGWQVHRQENQFIIGDIMTTPRFLKRYIIEALNSTVKQFFYFRAETIGPVPGDGGPNNSVKKHFPNELITYKIAHQNHRNWLLDVEGLNTRQQYLFFACLIVMVLLWTKSGWQAAIPSALQKAYYLLFLCLIINAFVCATFSTVVSRYQGRLIWLYIFTGVMIAAIKYLPEIRSRLQQPETKT
ncbi:MAG: hypothetical protein ABMA02_10085 [Saprospiraceae bacterium]